MKEKYITPVIEAEELVKADVLCGSFQDGNDNTKISGSNVFSLDGPVVFDEFPGME